MMLRLEKEAKRQVAHLVRLGMPKNISPSEDVPEFPRRATIRRAG